MSYIRRTLALLSVCLLGLTVGMADAAPRKVAPGSDTTGDYLYVFGPGGNKSAGAEDSLQVVFFEYPASLSSVELFVYHPGSGAKFERSGLLGFWTSVETQFTVYGGEGALTAAASQSLRPTANQPGTQLASETYGKNAEDGWVSLGTFQTSQAEVVGGTAYLKLVAEGISGSGANFFKVGTSAANAQIFGYDFTLHLPQEKDSVLTFRVPIPSGVTTVLESNYDMDRSNVPTLAGSQLRSSKSGEWLDNRVSVTGGQTAEYSIYRGDQGFANAGFHLADGEGRPLRAYFDSTRLPSQPLDEVMASAGTIDTTLLRLTKQMPERAAVNEEFDVTLTLTAKESIGNVQVVDMLPQGLELVSADPQPQRSGGTLAWHFESMSPGDVQVINMTVRATEATTYENCITVSAEPRACTVTEVGQPELAIVKSGPETAMIGEEIPYTITVRNTGTYTAKNVVVTDMVPEGLVHSTNQRELTNTIGDLEPGQERTVSVRLTSDRRGRVCNAAVASSDNAGDVRAEACTVIQQPGLEVEKTGPAEQFIGKQAAYDIVVRNTGDIDLTNVVVTDTIPAGTSVVSAPNAQVDGNRLTWRFERIPAGKAMTNLKVTLTSRTPGNRCNGVTVATAEGLSESAEACTLWKGYPALLIEVIDTVDPLQPGEETVFQVRVTNQGSAADKNVRITASFPGEMTPVAAGGDTQTTIKGKVVDAAAYPSLNPGEVITWSIKAKADKPGDARTKVELRSDLLTTPVTEEESTQVY